MISSDSLIDYGHMKPAAILIRSKIDVKGRASERKKLMNHLCLSELQSGSSLTLGVFNRSSENKILLFPPHPAAAHSHTRIKTPSFWVQEDV